MTYMIDGATPNRLAFWRSVGPKDLKPAAIRAGVCVATRQPGWARRVYGRSRRTHHVSAVRFQHYMLTKMRNKTVRTLPNWSHNKRNTMRSSQNSPITTTTAIAMTTMTVVQLLQ